MRRVSVYVCLCTYKWERCAAVATQNDTHTANERAHAGDLHMKEQQPICNKINSESSVISFIESLFCAHMHARARVYIYTLRSLAHAVWEERYQNTIWSRRAPAHAFSYYYTHFQLGRLSEINNEYISKPLSAKMTSQMLNYCMLTKSASGDQRSLF